MRSTLIVCLFVAIVLTVAAPVHASWVSEMLFGRHREFVEPGITIGIDEYFPSKWEKHSDLSFRYHKENDKIFAGTQLEIGALITSGSPADAKFAICITDEQSINGDLSGNLNFRLPERKGQIGGMRVLGTFRGKYGKVELKTADINPGTHYLYVFCIKRGKYQKFSEKGMALLFAPPLDEMIETLKDAPDETLKDWGLTSYQTLDGYVGERDTKATEFDIKFRDGGFIRGLEIPGRPTVGRLLGILTPDCLIGVIRVDSIDNGVVNSNSSSKFFHEYRGHEDELSAKWVIQVKTGETVHASELGTNQSITTTVFVEPDDIVRQGKIPWLNKRNFIIYSRSRRGDQNDFVRKGNFDREVRVANGHMYVKKCGNVGLMLEVEVERSITTSSSTSVAEYAYVPETEAKKCRVIRLSAGGTPVIQVELGKKSRYDTAGLFNGIAYIIGQRIRRPDRTNIDIDVSQSQQQQQQQQQEVAVDP